MSCGHQLPTGVPASAQDVPRSDGAVPSDLAPATAVKTRWYERVGTRWYEGTGNTAGIAIISFLVYANVLIKTLAGEALPGNETVYTLAWTSVVFYVMWKRRKRRGWIGAVIGVISGIVLLILAAAASRLLE